MGFAMAFLAATLIDPSESLIGMFMTFAFLWVALDMIHRASRNRVLATLPVGHRNLVTSFWGLAVMGIPLTFVAGEVVKIVTKTTFGTPAEMTSVLMTKRGFFAIGFAAAYSIFLAYTRRFTVQGVSVPVHEQLVLTVPAIFPIGTCVVFAWHIVSSTNQTGARDSIAILAAIALAWISFHYAESAWFPRSQSTIQDARIRKRPNKDHETPFPAGRGAACFHAFWFRYGKIGTGLWLTYFVALCMCTFYLEGSVRATMNTDLLAIFIGATILPSTILMPIFLPNVRSLRMIPLSRFQQALLQVSFPLSFTIPAFAVLPVAALLFEFPQIAAIAALAGLAAVHVALTVVMLRWGYRPAMVLAGILMVTIMAVFPETSVVPAPVFTVAALLAVLAFGGTYYLIGNSSRIYQRKSPLEEIIAMRQQQ
jgi:hypothetical protein